jgi:hypothetical protein
VNPERIADGLLSVEHQMAGAKPTGGA